MSISQSIKLSGDAGPIINLAEVKLFYQGKQLPPASLTFTLSSTYQGYQASNCNDGIMNNMCVSSADGSDKRPTLTISGNGLVDTVVVTNRGDSNLDRIKGAVITVTQLNTPVWTSSFVSAQPTYTFNVQGKLHYTLDIS